MRLGERELTRLSLLSSLVGLAAVYGVAIASTHRLTPIAKIDNGFVGTRVAVAGRVVDLSEAEGGHLFVKLQDDSGGMITVPIFSSLSSKLRSTVGLLDHMEVRGTVSVYRDELEVVPSRPEDVRVVHTAPASLSEIGRENLGRPVKVFGVIYSRNIIGAGNILLTLRENGGELRVFIPSKLAGKIPEIHVGDEVVIGGWLQLYNGEIELKVTSSACVQRLGAAMG